jgi:hypothetical protein
MNTSFLKQVLLVSLLMILLFSYNSCNKDDGPYTSYRISRMTYYYQDIPQIRSDFHYEDGSVTSIVDEYLYLEEDYLVKTEVLYPHPDSIIKTRYYLNSGSWQVEIRETIEMINGMAFRSVYTRPGNDGSWIEDFKYEFQYNDSNLTEIVQYQHGTQRSKINYEYNGPNLVQSLIYSFSDDWIISRQDTVFYNGDGIDSVISYQITETGKQNDFKYVYYFEHSLLTRIDIYDADSLSWRFQEKDTFTYDSHMNITSKTREMSGKPYKFEYIYEKGVGNYRQLIAPSDLYWDFYLLPEPVKSAPVGIGSQYYPDKVLF